MAAHMNTPVRCVACGRVRDAAYSDRTLIHQSSWHVLFENPRYHPFVPRVFSRSNDSLVGGESAPREPEGVI